MIIFAEANLIFANNSRMLEELHGIHGPYNMYNFTSMWEDPNARHINILPPIGIIESFLMGTKDFDYEYLNYIINYDPAFLDFMNIVIDQYVGVNSIILVSSDPEVELYTESLQKIYQERYGLVSNIIHREGDMYHLVDCAFDMDKILTLDIDKARVYNLLGPVSDNIRF